MKLKFSPAYLEKLEKFALSYHTTRDELIEKIENSLNRLSRKDFRRALNTGTMQIPYNEEVERYLFEDVFEAGFSVTIRFELIYKEDCLNWDEYLKYQILHTFY